MLRRLLWCVVISRIYRIGTYSFPPSLGRLVGNFAFTSIVAEYCCRNSLANRKEPPVAKAKLRSESSPKGVTQDQNKWSKDIL